MPWDIHKTSVAIDSDTQLNLKTFRVQAERNPVLQFNGAALVDTEGVEILTQFSIDGENWLTLEVITLAAGAAVGAISDLQDLSADDTVTRAPYFRWTFRPVNQAVIEAGEFANGDLTVAWWIDDPEHNGVEEI
jgi:hypothetical protein